MDASEPNKRTVNDNPQPKETDPKDTAPTSDANPETTDPNPAAAFTKSYYEPPEEFDEFIYDRQYTVEESQHDPSMMEEEFFSAVQPKDVVEYFWAYEVFRLMLEIYTLRSRKAGIQQEYYFLAMEEALINMQDGSSVKAIKEGLRIDARSKVQKFRKDGTLPDLAEVLAEFGHDQDALMAQALMLGMPMLEKIERLLDHASKRQRALLKEIDARRARKVREIIDKFVNKTSK